MIKKILRVILIFSRFAHPCVVIDVLTDVQVEDVIEILLGGKFFINVWAEVVIETLSDKQVDVIIDVMSGIGVEMLTDEVNVNVLLAVTTDLEFAIPAPLE